jgi:flagellar biosynthesis/type III secretory pathway protein FliH
MTPARPGTPEMLELAAAVAERRKAELYNRAIAVGCTEAYARAYAAAAAAAFLEAFIAGFAEGRATGFEQGRREERERLKAVRTTYAVHGADAQRWLMARELGADLDPAEISASEAN